MTDYLPVARRITRTLFAVSSLASAARVAFFPVASIIGAQLSGRPAWAGVPATGYILGGALSAFGWGHLMDPLGRRRTLTVGLLVGAGGATLAVVAVERAAFAVFLLASLLIGAAVSAVELSRFVAAEVHAPPQRARAISTVVLGGTAGAIFGPLLAGLAARLVQRARLEELAGPYVVTAALFATAALVVYLLLWPEPRDLARAVAAASDPHHAGTGAGRTLGEILRVPAATVAITAMVFGQLIMVMLMVITPLHMRGHAHPVSSISFVISAHVVGMYAFSIVSGRLADRLGRGPVVAAGAGILVLAGVSARLSPQVLPLTGALFLLGLGWNFCYVAGSSLLADQLSPAERGRTQGFNDLLIGLTSATGSLSSGIAFATIGYGAMAVVAAAAAVVPLCFAAWWQLRMRPVPAPS